MTLPLAGRGLDALELFDDRQQSGPPFGPGVGGQVLPASEEAHVGGERDGVDPTAAAGPAGGVDPDQQVARAPAPVRELDRRPGRLAPGQARAGPGDRHRHAADAARREGGRVDESLHGDRSGHVQVPTHALGQRLVGVDQGIAQRGDHQLRLGPPLGGGPVAADQTRPPVGHQLDEPGSPVGYLAAQDEREQEVVELVGVAWRGSDLVEDLGLGRRVEGGQLARGDREPGWQSVGAEYPEAPGHRHGPGASLLQRRTVEEGVGLAGQDPMGEGRGLRRLHEVHVHPAGLHLGEQVHQAVGVEGFRQAVVDGLADEHVVGHGHGARRCVLLAGGQRRPGGGQHVLGLHPLEVDGSPGAASGAGHDQGPVQIPPPPRGQHRVGQHGLDQHVVGRGALEHGGDLGQGEAVLGPEGEHDGVVVGGGLELEVEGDAEPLPQRQPERPVDPPSVRGVDDELGALGLVEHPLHHQPLTGGEGPEGQETGSEIGDDLVGDVLGHAGPGLHGSAGPRAVTRGQQRLELGAEVADLGTQLRRAGRGLAEPEGDGRRQVGGVDHPNGARLHLDHPPRVGAEQEDVAGGGFDGEVLVDRPDRDALRVQDDPVVPGLGDGAATGEGGQSCPPPGPEPSVDGVVVQVGAAPAPAGLDSPRGQVHHLVEVLAGEVGERCGADHQGEEGVDLPLVGGGHLGHHLLGQDVEGRHRRVEHVEVPGPDARQQGRALDQLVAGEGVEPTRRGALHMVVGPSDPLEEGGDRPGGADLADQLDRSDVDAQFERGGGDQGPQVTRTEPLLDDAPAGRRETPVVRGHLEGGVDLPAGGGDRTLLGAQAEGELVGHALGHLPGIDEDERRAVLEHVSRDPVQDVGELGAAGHRLELAARQLDGDVEVAGVSAVDDGRRGAIGVHSREQAGHDLEGPLRRRQSDALQTGAPLGHQVGQPFQAEGQMGAPLVAGQGVDLVDDDRVDAAQYRPRGRGGQQQVQRFGRGDQQVRWVLAHGRTLGGGRVARTDGHGELGGCQAQPGGLSGDPLQRGPQVLLDVDGERPQRRDVDDTRAAGRGVVRRGRNRYLLGPVGGVDGDEEAGQGLARAGGGGDQDIFAGQDPGPRPTLGLGRPVREAAAEPGGDGRVELGGDAVRPDHVVRTGV